MTHEEHVDELIRRNRGEIGLGTLFYYAHRFSGGTFTSREISASMREPGQVVCEDLFYCEEGQGYICYQNQIYFYSPGNGYYTSIPDDELLNQIAVFFDNYVTGFSSNGERKKYATPQKCQEALEWFKKKNYINKGENND